MIRGGGRGSAAALGAATALSALRLLTDRPPGGAVRWERTNHRGRTVSLLSGPALAVAVAAAADLPRSAATVAALGAAVAGAYDDASPHAGDKGFRGHVGALRRGRLTSGGVKVLAIGTTGLVSAGLLGGSRRDVLVGGAVVAASANLLNLFDLRPGRALKVAALQALWLSQPGLVGASVALLPDDLHERTMLGDAGANAVGAVLGLALLQRHPRRRGRALVVLTALTAASEVVSYSRVIDAVPPLRWADRAGRLP